MGQLQFPPVRCHHRHTVSSTMDRIKYRANDQSSAQNRAVQDRGCGFRSRRREQQVAHAEGHLMLFVCACGSFSSSLEALVWHSYRHEREFEVPIVQVDGAHWEIFYNPTKGLPEQIPVLPTQVAKLIQEPGAVGAPKVFKDLVQIVREEMSQTKTNVLDRENSVSDNSNLYMPREGV